MVRTGLEVWAARGFERLKGLRVGLIVNPTSVDRRFRHLAELAGAAPGVTVAALFGPEHGIRAEAQYMEAVDSGDCGARGHSERPRVPTYSLYGSTFESLSPRPEWLSGLDALVFDVQDVGARYYTYVATMVLAMRAAARAGLRFVVLDRPNPLGLAEVEGNLVGERFRSFVGLLSVPNRHGMTVGELARLANGSGAARAQLEVVACEGLRRGHSWAETGLHFVPPSPNMPTVDTALVYPGLCLLEGTNVSEGRGTCRPFEQFGAPWLDPDALVERLEALELPGVVFRPCRFTPTFDKYAGVSCRGAFLHVIDRERFRPVLTGIAVTKVCFELGPGHFAWRTDAYEFVDELPAFDVLCGTDAVRRRIEAGADLGEVVAGFSEEVRAFLPVRAEFLLYD